MFAALAKKVFGTSNDRILNQYRRELDRIESFAATMSALKDNELKAKTTAFKERLKAGQTLEQLLPEAFAVVREAATRVLGQRHYEVQLLGGIILHHGMIAEMKTGEGKTLVATLPSYLNALSGKGVHVVTANDYLARRDAEWMGKVHNFLGLSVGVIHHDLNDEQRQQAYNADITYCTNNELGFDYLRDHMKYRASDQVLRPFNFALIDEVDLVLIDEARTPLIISGSVQEDTAIYLQVDKIAAKISAEHLEIDEKARSVNLSEKGVEQAEKLALKAGLIQESQSLYDIEHVQVLHHLNQSLKARNLMQKDTDYIIRDENVVIIDEFTGRMMAGRRFGEGLHQAIEAKEGVKINHENQTLASITFQNLFRAYPRLAGMAGTAMTEAAEFEEIYKLKVAEVPTNIPVARIDAEDEIYATIAEKNQAIINAIQAAHQKGQPVLVGTVSIEKSEVLAKLLKKAKIAHHVLNAKFHEQEAFIIAQAGKVGAVTIATNMAGRGTDIKLGGNVDMMLAQHQTTEMTAAELKKLTAKITKEIEQSKQQVLAAGGLMVIGTERHESRRIDNQLRGRSGRQGDAGFTRFYLSLEDDLLRIFGTDNVSSMLAKLGLKDGEAIQHPWISKAIARAQGKVEARNFEMRKSLLKYDDVTNEQRQVIYEQRQDIINANDLSVMIEHVTADYVPQMVGFYLQQDNVIDENNIKALQGHLQQKLLLDINCSELEVSEIIAQVGAHLTELMAKKQEQYGAKVFADVTKYLALVSLDQLWKDHLHQLDHLRSGVGLRSYGQKDPLNEFKREAFEMFGLMLERFKENLLERLCRFELQNNQSDINNMYAKASAEHQGQQQKQDVNQLAGNTKTSTKTKAPIRTRQKDASEIDINNPETWGRVGRNSPCPCGSGKKFKHCHGAL